MWRFLLRKNAARYAADSPDRSPRSQSTRGLVCWATFVIAVSGKTARRRRQECKFFVLPAENRACKLTLPAVVPDFRRVLGPGW